MIPKVGSIVLMRQHPQLWAGALVAVWIGEVRGEGLDCRCHWQCGREVQCIGRRISVKYSMKIIVGMKEREETKDWRQFKGKSR
jgi:uncharacterized membrane protein YjdF